MQLRRKLSFFLIALLVIVSSITIYLINSTKPISTDSNSEKKPEAVEEITDNPPEIIRFTHTSSGKKKDSVVSGDVELQIEAKDDNLISKVEFYSSNGDY